MKVVVGSDHGGVKLKAILVKLLDELGHKANDVGTFTEESCDYPVIGAEVAGHVAGKKAQRGLLICRSGAGMAIVANKFPSVRAVVCQDAQTAVHSREHNNSNVLVLGADGLTNKKAKDILAAWLDAPFEGGRHARRVRQIREIEKRIGLC